MKQCRELEVDGNSYIQYGLYVMEVRVFVLFASRKCCIRSEFGNRFWTENYILYHGTLSSVI